MELSSAEMDGESCCFIWATSPFFLLRLLLLQRLFLTPIWIVSVRFYLDSLFHTPPFLLPFLLSCFLPSLLSYFDSPVGNCQFSLVYLLWFLPPLFFFFLFTPSFFLLRTHCTKWSSQFVQLSPITLSLMSCPLGLPCVRESTHTLNLRISIEKSKNVTYSLVQGAP